VNPTDTFPKFNAIGIVFAIERTLEGRGLDRFLTHHLLQNKKES